jgi:purine-nucleoside phosphorylase
LRLLGFSAISNVNRPDCMEPAPIEVVLKNAALAGERLMRIVIGVLKKS